MNNLSTRTGKIGRLPQAIRHELNQRIADGEGAQQLVDWLNGLDPVRERLAEYHQGRAITEHNISDWKQGGFLDWQCHEECRRVLRDFLDEAKELDKETDSEELLTDRATKMVTIILLKLFRQAAVAESGSEQRKAVLEIARELARLRRCDHQSMRVQMLKECRDEEFEDRQEKKDKELDEHLKHVLIMGSLKRTRYISGCIDGSLNFLESLEIPHFFHFNAEDLKTVGVPPLPTDQEIQAIIRERQAEEKKAGAGGKGRRKPVADSESAQVNRT
ncbi:MAG: hypothetical protein P4L99_26135 [Chthoniobacter sp.]|nr:hypothetical protein [Chthoniobacter sp.]